MIDKLAASVTDLKVGVRALARTKGLTITVIVTLALGIGANAAIFSLLRGVLLRPLVNRDEDHLIYIRQLSAGSNALFSVPEIADLRSRLKTLTPLGDFSTLGFTLTGLGEPRTVQAGVVGGNYFRVMGLRPVLGRLIDPHDDGPNATGAVVLTYRFWSTSLKSDPSVLGKTVELDSFEGSRTATIVGVLEPCVPYPQETEIIANMVTSPHHLSATMTTNRLHRMTELFGRLAPGVSLDAARAELRAVHGSIKTANPKDYKGDYQITAVRLRDQLTSGARTILLVLMGASLLVFVIACSNVANLILARTIRRETELGIRAALGATAVDLRRILLAESLLLCAGGATLGILIADPMLSVLSRYISRYSIRALDMTVDSSMLWVGVGLALVASVLLAFVPRLPSTGGARGFGLAGGSARVTSSANRRLRVFAVVQIAASFVLVAAAGATVKTLLSLESVQTGFDTRNVLNVDVPVMHNKGTTDLQRLDYYREVMRRIRELPGVQNISIGTSSAWRDPATWGGGLQFEADQHTPDPGHETESRFRVISPGYFATLGVPMIEGRDFTDADRADSDGVVIVSLSLARRMFPGTDALNHHVNWTDPILEAVPFLSKKPLRIIGIVADIDDMNVVPKASVMTVYQPLDQAPALAGGHLFVHARTNPYALVGPITRIIHEMSAGQPVERAQTLADVRTDVLSEERLNAIVSGVFAGVALLIAVVGVAGVLAFSVSGRIREFGIRLAVGSQPRNLLFRVIAEGAAIALGGLAVGAACGYWIAQLAATVIGQLQMPGALPVIGSAMVLLLAAVIASAIPAARAARIDVIQALRTE